MDAFFHIFSSVAVLAGLIVGAAGLKRLGLVDKAHGPLFGRLVVSLTLPALIFRALAFNELDWAESELALCMAGAELACLGLAWLAARLLGLSRPATGAFMLAAAFGSSTMLGYPLLAEIFPGNRAVISEAVLVSELGVGPVLFTFGVMLAMYFGGEDKPASARLRSALSFFVSPIFAAVAAGLAASALGPLEAHGALSPLVRALDMVGGANTLLVVLSVGIALNFENLRAAARPAAAACLLLLAGQPALAWLFSAPFGISGVEREVLVIESAMPSALLSVVLSLRYGCDASLASRLVLATAAASVLTVPLAAWLLG